MTAHRDSPVSLDTVRDRPPHVRGHVVEIHAQTNHPHPVPTMS